LIYRKYFTLLTGISLTGWLALWCLGSYTGFINPEFLTPPWELWSQFVLMAKEGYAGTPLFEHFYISLFRTLAGFALAILIGVPMGLLMGMSPIIHIQPPYFAATPNPNNRLYPSGHFVVRHR
jgi:taurine transport system permease protein